MKVESKPKNLIKIRIHYFLALILFIHTIIYLIYWISIGNLRGDVDLFIADFTGLTISYTTILIGISVGIGIWSLFRFVGMRYALRNRAWKPTFTNWIYFGVWILFLSLFYISYYLILQENPSQKGFIYQLINLVRLITDPLLFLIAAIWLRRLILSFRSRVFQAKKRWLWRIGVVIILILLVGLWLLPTMYPPNWAYQGDLPAKPALIAHRGASMLAPENTIAAAELAAEYEAFGFETDIRISLDGIPFLMHDGTLERTTNIAEVFPNRVDDDASLFTMDELRTLNAGLWFIQKDPFNTIDTGVISQAQLSINQGQKIPALTEALALVKENEMVILYDLRYPTEDHPYYEQFFTIVFDQCKESGINGDVWLLVDNQNLEIVLEEAPQMTRVIGASSTELPDPGELIELKYEIVNVDMGIIKEEIQGYRQEGLGVNVYTIDQPWLFSQFWLSGVTSITTNNIHTLSRMDHPIIVIPYSRFLIFWGLFGIIVAIWLASSQPRMKMTQQESEMLETPDLMDFAMEEDSKANTPTDTRENLDLGSTTTSEIEDGSLVEVDHGDNLYENNNNEW